MDKICYYIDNETLERDHKRNIGFLAYDNRSARSINSYSF